MVVESIKFSLLNVFNHILVVPYFALILFSSFQDKGKVPRCSLGGAEPANLVRLGLIASLIFVSGFVLVKLVKCFA
ncbi:hypothetical protein L2E82_05211 [Cichorium intybus]|uniref:Uncharacterized protein n=1 Tax=Cichorium intybus TaxID=13427 RepID=A0ACB9H913_CICIN|nr:hypothetical protein L2E82_05211 [Cichorium intybus]